MILWLGAPQGVLKGGKRRCRSGDKIVLVCDVISQNHVIKESCDFMGKSQSR